MKSHSQSSCLLFDSAKDIKHKISFLLQKPEPQTAEPKPKEKSTIAAAPAAAAAAAAAAEAAKRSADCFALWFGFENMSTLHIWEFEQDIKIPLNVSSVNAMRDLDEIQAGKTDGLLQLIQ